VGKAVYTAHAVSRLNDLLRELRNREPVLARDLEREVSALNDRRAFGLNFERHVPEAVELPGRPVRKGDNVRVLPPRGNVPKKADEKLWRVVSLDRAAGKARLEAVVADAESGDQLALAKVEAGPENVTVAIDDLVVVAGFRDAIYPGLVSTGKVERGGDKPFHTVINAENYHALETLLFTHRGNVDCIYIDPPYNTGAKDWKYNNDYVEGDDLYRHSKWLAFMERRLLLAKELLNPKESVLIVTIDEKEYLRLGLLLEQAFPEANVSMVSSIINPAGAGRNADFSRTDEYIYFVRLGAARILPEQRNEERRPVTWDTLRRSDLSSARPTRPAQFYPFYVNLETRRIEGIGDALPSDVPRESAPQRSGCIAVFPVRPDGTELNWGITAEPARKRLEAGYLRVGKYTAGAPQPFAISYLTAGIIEDIRNGRVEISGRAPDGSVIANYVTGRLVMPTTAWNKPSHDAQRYGTEILKALMPDRRFPFPKSLYAVEECLRHVIAERREAIVVDFFSGSGTTAHAVMRLNRQDGGQRRAIVVTNNEVASDEQKALREKGLRPGDPEWERWGICEHITKPRIKAAITGKTPDGEPIKGDYKFTDEFAMADGFEENVEFFTLTYEAPLRVASNREFTKIAPLLWLRAGSRGRRITDISRGWDVADVYGVLANIDHTDDFLKAVAERDNVRLVYVVTDEDRIFESVSQQLPAHVEPVRLYEAYLRNFEIESGRGVL
jgi:adenine-specific DNA-methyltransferase